MTSVGTQFSRGQCYHVRCVVVFVDDTILSKTVNVVYVSKIFVTGIGPF